jgi:IS30 family transposase
MQIIHPHKAIVALSKVVAPEKSKNEYMAHRLKVVQDWELLEESGVSIENRQKILGKSKATYYRYKKSLTTGIIPSKRPKTFRKSSFGEDMKLLILKIRKENPTYGKAKIAVILKRDFKSNISESSVGRILKKLGVARSASALRTKRKRVFDKYAKPWQFKDYKTMKLGESVQIDHMTVTKNGVVVKHFAAWDRRSKFVYANCYCNATSQTARKFLESFIKSAPYKVLSIQVDGGSEFRQYFEEICEKLGIPLFVLPPAKPKYNGGVERSNRIFREEFYNKSDLLENSVVGMRRELLEHVRKYNTYRPHSALQGMTPMEYIKNVQETTDQSHML